MKYSESQIEALHEEGHITLTAAPGSGKTTIIAEKIRKLASRKKESFGAIAVSYTNKASNHLRDIAKKGGTKLNNCFFGTLDRFILSELIHPFARETFKLDTSPEILSLEQASYRTLTHTQLIPNQPLEAYNQADLANNLLRDNIILYEHAANCGFNILCNSNTAKRYITSTYTHIIVDEYQDCGEIQHKIFLKMFDLGLTCIAAGDPSQSIFVFAKKNPKYLIELINNPKFKSIEIEENFRSHKSIVLYSKNFKHPLQTQTPPVDDCRIVALSIAGGEIEIYNFINNELQNHIDIKYKTIGIFTKSNAMCIQAGDNISNSITISKTPLDKIDTPNAALCKDILSHILDKEKNSYDLAERYQNATQTKLEKTTIRQLFLDASKNSNDPSKLATNISAILRILTKQQIDEQTLKSLKSTLNSPAFLSSYSPLETGHPYILTYHKSKGLEFDIVFMLSLYKYVFPYENPDKSQDDNLFYVGITRPKELLYLCTSTKRTFNNGRFGDAVPSEYFTKNNAQQFYISYDEHIKRLPLPPS